MEPMTLQEIKDFDYLKFGGEKQNTYKISKTDLKQFMNKYLKHAQLVKRCHSTYLPMPITLIIIDKQSMMETKLEISDNGTNYLPTVESKSDGL